MKNPVKAYITFTRMERMGIMVLSTAIVILIIVLAGIHYFSHLVIDTEQEQQFARSWEVYKRSQHRHEEEVQAADSTDEYQDAYDDNERALPTIININTADSATLVRLKGIGPATASKIVARRQKQPFTSVEQILEVRSIPRATFEVIRKHMTVSDTTKH